MSPLTREASSETPQHGEPSIVACPIVKSATSASAFRIPLVVPLGAPDRSRCADVGLLMLGPATESGWDGV
jgi:hypothetical protein